MIMYLILFTSIPLELLAFTLPIAIPGLPFVEILCAFSIFQGLFGLIPMLTYLFKVRKMISEIQISRDFYDKIQGKLTKILQTNGLGGGFAVLLVLTWVIIPIFHENLYIVYNINVLFSHLGVFQSLYVTSSESQTPVHSKESIKMISLTPPDGSSHHHPHSPTLSGKESTFSVDQSIRGDPSLPLFNPFVPNPEAAEGGVSSRDDVDQKTSETTLLEKSTSVDL